MSETLVVDGTLATADSDRGVLYEVVGGEYRATEPMGAFEQSLASVLEILMGSHCLKNGLGLVVTEVLFSLREQPRLHRRPDVAFVSFDRWPEPTVPEEENAWGVVPDLAVEIVSPTNLAVEIDGKLSEYLEAGVRQIWVLYPRSRRLMVFESPTRVSVYQAGDVVDGGSLLPGFRLDIDALFAALTRPSAENP